VAGYRVPPEQWKTYRDTPFLVNAHPFLEAAVRERQTVLSSGATQDGRYDSVLAQLIPAQSVLLTPLIVRGEVIGVVGLAWWEETRRLDAGAIELIEGIVHQAAVAVENARLFEAARSRAEELTVLNDLARALTARLDVDQVLQETHRGVARLVDTANFFIGLYNAQRHEVTIPLNITESQMDSRITVVPADQGITGYMIRNRTSVLIKDDMAGWQEKMGVQLVGQSAASWLGVPLMIGDQVIGVMAVQNYTTPRAYDEDDQELLIAIASQAAVALQNAQLFEQSQIRARSERRLREVVAAVSASEDLVDSLPTVMERLGELVPVDRLTVAAYTPGDSEYRILDQSAESEKHRLVQQAPRASLDGTAAGWVITHSHIWMDTDFRETQPFRQDADLVAEGLVSRIVLPLRAGRTVIGALNILSSKPGAYSEAVVPILEQVADQMALALERERLLAETRAALAEVEAAHRSYLRRGWQDHLRQREVLRGGGYVYDQTGIEDTGAVELVPGLWRPEMEEALRSAAPAVSLPEPLPAPEDTHATQPIGKERDRTGLAVPIVLRGQVLGVLGVEAPSGGRQWTGDDVALVEAIADQLGQALESARLFAETQRRVERERIIGEITAKVRSSTDVQRILETAAQELGQVLGASRAVVRLGLGDSVSRPPDGTSPGLDADT
jgi:GAF domain-containing protein